MFAIIITFMVFLGGQPSYGPQDLIYTPKKFDSMAACESFRNGPDFAASVANFKIEALAQIPGDDVKVESRCESTEKK